MLLGIEISQGRDSKSNLRPVLALANLEVRPRSVPP